MIKEKTACFTGHRPEKLPGCKELNKPVLSIVKSMLYYQIYQAIESGYEYFISGVARGVDLWAALYVIEIKKKFPNIKLICAKPYEDHGNQFKGEDLWDFKNILAKADEIISVSKNYSPDCFRLRNCFMVDHSSRLIAVVDNYKSGTGQTISYANKKGIEVNIINVKDYLAMSPETEYRNAEYFYLK